MHRKPAKNKHGVGLNCAHAEASVARSSCQLLASCNCIVSLLAISQQMQWYCSMAQHAQDCMTASKCKSTHSGLLCPNRPLCTRRWIRRLCCGGHQHQSPLASSCRCTVDVSIYQRCSSGPSQPALQPTGQPHFRHLRAVVNITHMTLSVMHICCNSWRLSSQMYCFDALSPSHSSLLLLSFCSTVPV